MLVEKEYMDVDVDVDVNRQLGILREIGKEIANTSRETVSEVIKCDLLVRKGRPNKKFNMLLDLIQ